MTYRGSVRSVIAWLGGLDLILLVAVLAMVAGALGFIVVADRVMEGKTLRIDDRLIRSLRNPGDPTDPIGPRNLSEVGLTGFDRAATIGSGRIGSDRIATEIVARRLRP